MRTPVLNRKLVLEAATQVPDGAGGFSEVWNALGTLWAQIIAGTGREVNAGGLAVSSVPCKIMVRGKGSMRDKKKVRTYVLVRQCRSGRLVLVPAHNTSTAK